MRGAKALDGHRVKLLVSALNMAGHKFSKGEEGLFRKRGVKACTFTTDDGRRIMVGSWSAADFEVVEVQRRPQAQTLCPCGLPKPKPKAEG